MSDWFGLAVAMLATWRLSHLVASEDGPFDLMALARRAAGQGHLGHLLDCPYCLSLWFAAPMAAWLAAGWGEGLMEWLAISGGACLIQRLNERWGGAPVLEIDDLGAG